MVDGGAVTDALSGGLAGLAKTAGHEWSEVARATFEYSKSRIRVCRGWTFNAPLLFVTSNFYFWTIEFPLKQRLFLTFFLVILFLIIGIGAYKSWLYLSRNHYARLTHYYLEMKNAELKDGRLYPGTVAIPRIEERKTQAVAPVRLKMLRSFLWGSGFVTLIYWPFSHWFFPDWYHNLLGFSSYDLSLVRIIGTLGLLPVMGFFMVARDPLRNRDFLFALIAISVLIALTYVFLIHVTGFPIKVYINIAILLFNAIVMSLLYPWQDAWQTGQNQTRDE